jgi:ABC-type hemin transport system ATPase subunit
VEVRADRVCLEGPHGPLLPATSLTVAEGRLVVVHGEPGAGLTAFGLALAGRLKPTGGTVTVDGTRDDATLRDLVAVVDAPGVSEPDGALTLRVVVAEELSLGHHRAGRADVTRWLDEHQVAAQAGTRFENLGPPLRTRVLTALAAQRRGVRMLMLDTPDRHTADVASWSDLALKYAERGLAVVVLSATTALTALPTRPIHLGETDPPQPQRCQEHAGGEDA